MCLLVRVMKNALPIQAWNNHHIPGPEGGVPNTLAAQNTRITHLTPHNVPSTQIIVQHHETGGLHLRRDAKLVLILCVHTLNYRS